MKADLCGYLTLSWFFFNADPGSERNSLHKEKRVSDVFGSERKKRPSLWNQERIPTLWILVLKCDGQKCLCFWRRRSCFSALIAGSILTRVFSQGSDFRFNLFASTIFSVELWIQNRMSPEFFPGSRILVLDLGPAQYERAEKVNELSGIFL